MVNSCALASVVFVAFWMVLSISTFGLHHRLDHKQGWPSQKAAVSRDEQDGQSRVALQGRVDSLEEHVLLAEAALEHLVSAATAQHAAAASSSTQAAQARLRQVRTKPVANAAFTPSPPPLPGKPAPEKAFASPGFAGHVILSLNDTAFRATPVDTLMSRYGSAGGGGSCDDDFGMGLIKRWRGAAKPCCSARPSEGSSLTCHLVKQTRHHGSGDQLLTGTNVRIDYSDFASRAVTDKVLRDYITSTHQDAAYIHYSKGNLAASCEVDASIWKKDSFPGENFREGGGGLNFLLPTFAMSSRCWRVEIVAQSCPRAVGAFGDRVEP